MAVSSPARRNDDSQRPGPWRFHANLWGFRNVIADRDGRYIVANVPANCGPLLAAAPTLIAARLARA